MKKLNFFLIGILAIFATIITFSSCNKAEVTPSSSLENHDETLERILDFKQKVENPNQQKSTEEVSVEEAVWLVEAALNYSYCIFENEIQFNDMQLDSLCFDISSNELDFSEVVNIYNEINLIITSIQENNTIYIIDVFFEAERFKAKIFYGDKKLTKSSPSWNGFTREYNYTEADEAIENAVNRTRTLKVLYTPYYITDIETTQASNANFDSYLRNYNSNDPCYEYYYMFFEYSENIDPFGTWSPVLSIDEMNFYYNGAFMAADLVKANENIESQKQFLSINLEDDAMFTGEAYYPILHWYEFTYGILRPANIITE